MVLYQGMISQTSRARHDIGDFHKVERSRFLVIGDNPVYVALRSTK